MSIQNGEESMGYSLSGKPICSTSEKIGHKGSRSTNSIKGLKDQTLKDKTDQEEKKSFTDTALANEHSKILLDKPNVNVVVSSEATSNTSFSNSAQDSLGKDFIQKTQIQAKKYTNRDIQLMFRNYVKLTSVNSVLAMMFLTSPGSVSEKQLSPAMLLMVRLMTPIFEKLKLPLPYYGGYYQLTILVVYNMVAHFGEHEKHFQSGDEITMEYRTLENEPKIFVFKTEDFLNIIAEAKRLQKGFSLRSTCKSESDMLNILCMRNRIPSYYVRKIENEFNIQLTDDEKVLCFTYNTHSRWVQDKHFRLFKLLNQDKLKENFKICDYSFYENEDY